MSEVSELLKIPDVATHLGVGRSKVYAMLASGEMRAFKIGRATRVRATEVERVINALPQATFCVTNREAGA